MKEFSVSLRQTDNGMLHLQEGRLGWSFDFCANRIRELSDCS